MDILRRNTDYALRAVLHLAKQDENKAVPTSTIAEYEGISYQLACKLLQKLQKARLVKSTMGPKGGFQLAKDASKISLQDIIYAIQKPITINRCLSPQFECLKKNVCLVYPRLKEIQAQLEQQPYGYRK